MEMSRSGVCATVAESLLVIVQWECFGLRIRVWQQRIGNADWHVVGGTDAQSA